VTMGLKNFLSGKITKVDSGKEKEEIASGSISEREGEGKGATDRGGGGISKVWGKGHDKGYRRKCNSRSVSPCIS